MKNNTFKIVEKLENGKYQLYVDYSEYYHDKLGQICKFFIKNFLMNNKILTSNDSMTMHSFDKFVEGPEILKCKNITVILNDKYINVDFDDELTNAELKLKETGPKGIEYVLADGEINRVDVLEQRLKKIFEKIIEVANNKYLTEKEVEIKI